MFVFLSSIYIKKHNLKSTIEAQPRPSESAWQKEKTNVFHSAANSKSFEVVKYDGENILRRYECQSDCILISAEPWTNVWICYFLFCYFDWNLYNFQWFMNKYLPWWWSINRWCWAWWCSTNKSTGCMRWNRWRWSVVSRVRKISTLTW